MRSDDPGDLPTPEATSAAAEDVGADWEPHGFRGRRFALTAADLLRAEAAGGCSICTAELLSGESAIELHCGHLFHSGCLKAWLEKQPTCPLCRSEAVDVESVVDRIVAEIHSLEGRGEEAHRSLLLPHLERLGALARDARFAGACARSCTTITGLALSHRCHVTRSLVLEVILAVSRRRDLRPQLADARDPLFVALGDALRVERPSLRAVACGIIWNLAIPSQHAAELSQAVGEFMGEVVRLTEDGDEVVAYRATRALWFIVQAPGRARQLLQAELPTVLRRTLGLGPAAEELGLMLQVLSHCMEVGDMDTATCARIHADVFDRVPHWLRGTLAVCVGALHVTLMLSRFLRPEHTPAWHALFDDQGPLRPYLCARSSVDASFSEARAQVLGIAWNLALNAEGRKPLADRALGGLLAVAQEVDAIDAVTRERLVTALWHLSKDSGVAREPLWIDRVEALCRHVELLREDVRMHGLQMLDHLCQAQGAALTPLVMPQVWRQMGAEDIEESREATAVFSIFLALSTHASAKEWVWRQEGMPGVLARALDVFQRSTQTSSQYAKAQLVGAVWNLAMDDGDGHREKLGRAFLPSALALFRDPAYVVAARACTAAFHLVKCPGNASLLRDQLAGDAALPELLPALLERLDDEERQFHLLSAVCQLCSLADLATSGFNDRLGPTLVAHLDKAGFFEMPGAGAAPAPGRSARLACVSTRLLLRFSGSCDVCAELIRMSALRDDGMILRLVSASVSGCLQLEARAHVVGVIWNMAVAEEGKYRRDVAARAMPKLLDLSCSAPEKLDDMTRARLVTALFHLSKDADASCLPQWLDALSPLCEHVAHLRGDEGILGLQVLEHISQDHGVAAAKLIMPSLWKRLDVEDFATRYEALAVSSLFLALSAGGSATEWLWPCGDASLLLTRTSARLAAAASDIKADPEVDAEKQKRLDMLRFARAQVVGGVWNVALEDNASRREALGAQFLPMLPDMMLGESSSLLARRAVTCAFHLCRAPGNLLLMRQRVWELFGCKVLNDETCFHLLMIAMNVLVSMEQSRADGEYGCLTASSAEEVRAASEHAVQLLAGDEWRGLRSPREDWPRVLSGEMRLLLQVSKCEAAGRKILDSGFLGEGGSLRGALAPPTGRARDPHAHEARAHALGVVWNLAVADGGSLRVELSGLILDDVLKVARVGHQLDAGPARERAVMALFHLSRNQAVAADVRWKGALPSVAALVHGISQRGSSAHTYGTQMLNVLLSIHGSGEVIV